MRIAASVDVIDFVMEPRCHLSWIVTGTRDPCARVPAAPKATSRSLVTIAPASPMRPCRWRTSRRSAEIRDAVTVRVAVPVAPWLVAVTVGVPGRAPVTRPSSRIQAWPACDVDQVMAGLATGWPPASVTVAVKRTVSPTSTDAMAGVTRTVAVGVEGATGVVGSSALPHAAARSAAATPTVAGGGRTVDTALPPRRQAAPRLRQ